MQGHLSTKKYGLACRCCLHVLPLPQVAACPSEAYLGIGEHAGWLRAVHSHCSLQTGAQEVELLNPREGLQRMPARDEAPPA